jgi:hypothetical protein
MALKTEEIIGLSIGGGLLCIGGYLLYDKWLESRLLEEYMDKVAKAENEFANAIAREDYETAERISDFYSSLMKEEEEIIERKGMLDKLRDVLWAAGFLVGMWGFYRYILKIIYNRWGRPPGGFKCGFCDKTFSTSDELDSHMKKVHSYQFVEEAVSAAEAAYRTLHGWVKGLISVLSGVEEWVMDKPWTAVPQWVLITIAVAALVLVAVLWWVPGIGAALAKIGAMVLVTA